MEGDFGTITDPKSVKPDGRICTVAIDDLEISRRSYEDHVRQVSLVLEKAEMAGAEFKLDKCVFADSEAVHWGCRLDEQGRRATEGKIEQIRNWPPYQGLEYIRSHVHFIGYLK